MATFADRLRGLTPVLTLLATLAAVVAAIALWKLAGETAERSCIERAEARYPGVPVSTSADRGSPVRLSYDRERRAAVDDCD